ncbi:MAG: hypothetical protein AB7U73_01120 [Pirellulales bacterium]
MKIYLASSWRNMLQPFYLTVLRRTGHEVYDFRNPHEGDHGFAWREIDSGWKAWTSDQFVKCLQHPIAERGFRNDFEAMQWADAGVLLLPCGRSAHLEAGYFVGAGKPLYIIIPPGETIEPELMYKMASAVLTTVDQVFDVFGNTPAQVN